MPALSTRGATTLKGLTLSLTGAAARPAAAQTAYGITVDLTQNYNLVTFQVTAPGTFTATAPITGLASGQTLVGIDTRPATGQLFALGYNAAATTSNAQLYPLATTGALTPVGSVQTLALGNDDTHVGFDFNPTVDRIRVVGKNGGNYRLNPNSTAASVLTATDGRVTYTSGTNTPNIGTVAYTNSFMGASAASGTTLYNYDQVLNVLNTQATANPPSPPWAPRALR